VSLRDLVGNARDTASRLLPHRAATGLFPIGDPGRDSPVLLTGNFTLTVRRLRRTLRGADVWLLVANSRGINVWCAAGGGHLSHHDVISVLRTSGISDVVDHRTLLLPQLAATGVERRPIEAATGWSAVWGPARLEDLPAVLARGGSVHGRERRMRFPLWERIEMASMWFLPTALILGLLAGFIGGWRLGTAAATSIVLAVAGIFVALPRLTVTGPARWLTYGVFALFGAAFGTGMLGLLGRMDVLGVSTVTVASLISMAVLSIDLTGTTPLYPSSINTRSGAPRITLDSDRCTGAADCISVCPSGVLRLHGTPPKADIAHPDACIACGACIVQCPDDAFYFTMPDGQIVEPSTIRTTRLNLLGDRTVDVPINVGE
jgi:NAD-dependent dihydropyrimidine dehydrogenase PreA subunit